MLIAFKNSPDPDPYFHLNSDLDPGSQASVFPCGSGSGSCLEFAVTKKLNFYIVGHIQYRIYVGTKAF
jgi:hypothetical protein